MFTTKTRMFLAISFLLPMGSGNADSLSSATPPLPLYVQECGACHLAFPARALPAASWSRIMQGLGEHYGTDASVDAVTQRKISVWLTGNSSNRRPPPPEDRITRSSWFIHEHDGIAAQVWKRPAIKSTSNCAACHTDAAQGNFEESSVRIPRN